MNTTSCLATNIPGVSNNSCLMYKIISMHVLRIEITSNKKIIINGNIKGKNPMRTSIAQIGVYIGIYTTQSVDLMT